MKVIQYSIFLISLLVVNSSLLARPLAKEAVPEPLKPWVEWVMYAQDKESCIHSFNRTEERYCAWSTALKLELDNKQGHFSQHWQVQTETWIRLPGNKQQWPHDVLIEEVGNSENSTNKKKAVVVSHNGYPSVKLPAGQHIISGTFLWDSLPESLTIPPTTGLIHITHNGKAIEFPRINKQGQLWLDKSREKKSIQDALDVQVYRKIDDNHPMTVQTRLVLSVSGHSREVLFPKVQLDGFTALKLKSQLPARINQQGDLLMQVRPGNWQIDLVSYKSGVISELDLPESGQGLPKQEVWVFKANPSLRLTEISGVPAIDSRQTRLPKEWQSHPAYLVDRGKTMHLKTLQRGSGSPEPNRLILNRTMWMDFSGDAYTINDRLSGTMTRDWRLISTPELQLGSASMDGEPQFITLLENGKDTGVEVRRGKINLEAASRYTQSISDLPVSGWKHDFQLVNTTLFLAPGWTLFSAYGSDNIPGTWLQSWTLLDLFLVLMIGIAIARLWDWKWGIFAILTMVLIWHEANAPKYIWLNLLAAIALLRVLPNGFMKKLVWGYRNITLLALILTIILFSVSEIRSGLYPQLGLYSNYDSVYNPTMANYGYSSAPNSSGMMNSDEVIPEVAASRVSKKLFPRKELKKKPYGMRQDKAQNANQMVDPNANIQTGPGLPNWSWQRVSLVWSSPVKQSQRMQLTFISPRINLLLSFLRVILLLILIGRLLRVISIDEKNSKKGGGGYRFKLPTFLNKKTSKPNSSTVSLFIICFALLLLSPFSTLSAEVLVAEANKQPDSTIKIQATGFPSDQLLKKLQGRLLEKADCLPNCAQIEAMRLELSEQALTLYLQIHTAAKVAVPLPGNSEQWSPQQVLSGNQPAQSLYRDSSGVLWIGLEKGINQVILQGRLPNQSQVQLALPMAPKTIEWKGEGWTVEGIRENHLPVHQLQLVRKQVTRNAQASKKNNLSDNNYLPPLLHIERTLHLGLDWFIDTQVTRLSAIGTPLSMKVPLLEGESLLSNDFSVKSGKVLINMSSTQRQINWHSKISVSDKLLLLASTEKGLVESWKLDISPIWHVEITGIPEIHHENQASVWLPEWKPWPGEKVELEITRPKGVAGKNLTIERSILKTHVGKRLRETDLTLKIRSSRGGQHPIKLPENAELISVSINSKFQPVRQQGNIVNLPIIPGEQTIIIRWRSNEPISTKISMLPVNVGIDNVNNSMHLLLGRDRWVFYTHGPIMGPAVLYWGGLLVILLGSILLGRIKNSPLRHWQWFLLGAGLSLAAPFVIIIVVGWLLALSYRPKLTTLENRFIFNGAQVLLILLTLIALGSLFFALQQGLLGWPDMQISGNGSNAYELHWYQDRSPADLPQPWVLSVPLLVYRVLMLLWALWLAFSLINWLRIAWQNYSEGGLWRAKKRVIKKT